MSLEESKILITTCTSFFRSKENIEGTWFSILPRELYQEIIYFNYEFITLTNSDGVEGADRSNRKGIKTPVKVCLQSKVEIPLILWPDLYNDECGKGFLHEFLANVKAGSKSNLILSIGRSNYDDEDRTYGYLRVQDKYLVSLFIISETTETIAHNFNVTRTNSEENENSSRTYLGEPIKENGKFVTIGEKTTFICKTQIYNVCLTPELIKALLNPSALK